MVSTSTRNTNLVVDVDVEGNIDLVPWTVRGHVQPPSGFGRA